MEGTFAGKKLPTHLHANMAKAAVNMMTCTLAQSLAAKCGVHMNSVDAGWINLMEPAHKTRQFAAARDFLPPLDGVDGAACILDPIFTQTTQFRKFLKDCNEMTW